MERKQKIDFGLLIATIALAGVGIVMVYSSSMYTDDTLFLKKQAFRLMLGFLCMLVTTVINYRGYEKLAKGMLYFGLFLLVAVLVQPDINGATKPDRWLSVFGLFTFQPSEFMKVFLIIFLAASIANMGERIRKFSKGFMPMFVAIIVSFILIAIETDLSSAGFLLVLGFVILFLGRAKLLHIASVIMPAGSLVALVILFNGYMRKRLISFVSAEPGYQVLQSLIAIGNGGLKGIGLGNSVQKYNFLPEKHTDFIFSIFAEERGFIGTTLLLMLMFYYLYRGFKVAEKAPDVFGFLLAAGLTIMTGLQMFINIAVTVRLLPTTGMTLPFISFGGTSLLLTFIASGILLNISRYGNYEQKRQREFGTRLHTRSVWE